MFDKKKNAIVAWFTFSKVGFTFFLIIILNVSLVNAQIKGAVLKPLIWNINNLNRIKGDTTNAIYKETIRIGDKCLLSPPVSVKNKIKTFAPDKHYYCSLSRYCWPDFNNSNGRYLIKDGYVNPEINEYDRPLLGEMANRCRVLSVVYYWSGEEKYYDAFVNQLKAWFVNEDTYMYPNLEYSQVVPGRNDNKGNLSGAIDSYQFNDVLEAVRLVNLKNAIDEDLIWALQKWFLSFIEWNDSTDYYNRLFKINNNIGLAYDVTFENILLFVGNYSRAKSIAESFGKYRINVQITENGEQPAELVRTKSLSYSLYNLEHIMDFCFLMRFWEPDYYINYRTQLDTAFSFLLKYICDKESYPYKQITSWKDCQQRLLSLLYRRKNLLGAKFPLDCNELKEEVDPINNLISILIN